MRKIIGINCRFLARRATGVDRFAREIVSALNDMVGSSDPVLDGFSIKLLVPGGGAITEFPHLDIQYCGKRSGQLWEQMDLPGAMDNGGLLVNLCNTAPVFLRKQLVVIHDVATARVPESYGRLFRAWYSLLIPRLYRTADSICTVSAFSRSEMSAIFGLRGDVCVLPEGTDHIDRLVADRSVLDRYALSSRPYVLAVSSLSPHKNFSAVVKAVELMGDAGFDVVIAGGQNPQVFSGNPGDLPASVKYVGYVTDEELKALYENAACFVFPSIYEGYGLPPTEAMAAGCPVLAARAASIPEVCGDAALYFDPRDPSSLAAGLRTIIDDQELRSTLRIKGRERAKAMRWRDAALALVNEIRRVTA
jgi:glycosyltransferase involved in cell wall biosynthesis